MQRQLIQYINLILETSTMAVTYSGSQAHLQLRMDAVLVHFISTKTVPLTDQRIFEKIIYLRLTFSIIVTLPGMMFALCVAMDTAV